MEMNVEAGMKVWEYRYTTSAKDSFSLTLGTHELLSFDRTPVQRVLPHCPGRKVSV